MTDVAILDTSWLLELYEVPGDSKRERRGTVVKQAEWAIQVGMLVTVPVLFEVADHIVRVSNGDRRRKLIKKYRNDVVGSLEKGAPWAIVPALREDDILLRVQDLVDLAGRFARDSSVGYSLANISVIDLVLDLQKKGRTVTILTFNKRLEAYAS